MNCNGSLSEVIYNALWDLYNSTNGIHWTWSTQMPASTIWTFPSNLSTPCSDNWQGLECSREAQNTCSLEEIVLISRRLRGYIPSSLGNIPSLTNLQLAQNFLTATIPSELGNLQSLRYLGLYINNLTGTIPSELGNYRSMERLGLGINCLTGSIPSELGNLGSMKDLDLYINHLSGTIPSELGYLQSMIRIGLGINCLSGTIPTQLGNLRSMMYLYFDTNGLSGTIPSELGNLQLMDYLALNLNNLTGTIPSELGNLRSMQYLYLDVNSLSGTIPNELGNLTSMLHLGLYINCLSGFIPSELGNLSLMKYLYLGNNTLSGPIPCELGNLRKMQYLYMGSNNLFGSIPYELGNMSSIIYFDLNSNCLSGHIPASVGHCRSLKYLSLHSNDFSGAIASVVKNLSSVEVMWLNHNLFTGDLTGVFDDMSLLSSLSLSENGFEGSILNELVHLKRLSYLYVDQNLFTGTMPLWTKFPLLQQLDISRNFISGGIDGLVNFAQINQIFAAQNLLSGSIPESFSCFVLECVDFSDNSLDGSIGLQFSNCSRLQSIGLGGNALTGTIPDYFGDITTLVSLNLSNNELAGDLHVFAFYFSNGSLQSLDVSSNRLSGTVPFQLFKMTSLQDMLLYRNCFSGLLPETMCSNSNLEYLVMNDLTSNCGSGIPKPLRPILHGAVSQRLMSGSIPDCVWRMSGLKLLQLSGNGLTGSIGEPQLVNDSSLRSLLLSGNQLTGTIPEWIQTSSTMEQLDLSKNRLSGTLMGSLMISSASSLFRASVNRLSGDLPVALFSTPPNLTLDMLRGNQFSCSFAGTMASWGSILYPANLPESDVNRYTYVCGSSFFDDYLLFASACSLVLGSVVFLFLFVRSSAYFMPSCQNLRSKLHFENCHGWNALFLLSLLLLVLFVSLHSSALALFRTHSEQYLWMTTAAFLRGWAPVLIVLLSVSTGEIVVTSIFGGSIGAKVGNSQDDVFKVQKYRRAFCYTTVHLLNIVAVIATNSAYVYATVKGLPLTRLIIIQFGLGCFKLAWNNVAIPQLLRFLTTKSNLTAHRMFMSLFAFIGGPFISTFFTASNCFLYVVTLQPSLTSIVIVPQYSCSSNCLPLCVFDECEFYCPSNCRLQPMYASTTSMSSWIYSYQCSSALLLNYVPVMIASMTISGVFLPCFVISQLSFNPNRGVIFSWLVVLAPRSMLIGDAFDVTQLNRFLKVKTLVNITIILTFGFAGPLLGMLTVLDSLIWVYLRKALVNRQVDYLRSKNLCMDSTTSIGCFSTETITEQFGLALEESPSFDSFDILILLSFVGVFWSLFVFDMIGDVYGSISGGLSMLAPGLLGVSIWFKTCYRSLIPKQRKQSIDRSAITPGFELTDQFAENPVNRSKTVLGKTTDTIFT